MQAKKRRQPLRSAKRACRFPSDAGSEPNGLGSAAATARFAATGLSVRRARFAVRVPPFPNADAKPFAQRRLFGLRPRSVARQKRGGDVAPMGRQRIGKSRFGTAADPLLSADQHAAKRRYCLYDRCRQIEKHTDSIRTVVARTDRRNLEPAPRTTRTGTVEDQNEHRIGYAELQRTDPCRDRRHTIRKRFGNLPEIGRRSREQRTIATGDRRTKRRGRHHRSESADRDPVECRCADRPVHALRHLYESAPELAGSRTDRPRPLPPDQRHESRKPTPAA